jgi:hypothetical protein
MGLEHSRDVEIKLQASVGYDGTAAPDTFFTSAETIATAKTWDLNEGEYDFDQQDYLGEASTGFQNMGKVRKTKQPAELTITVDYNGLKAIQTLLYDASTAVGASYTALSQGNAARKEVDVVSIIDDGTDEVQYLLQNAEQVGPTTKVTGTDGQVEYELKLKCLAKDYVGPVFANTSS